MLGASHGGQSQGQDDPNDPLAALQEVIQDVHHLITVLPDPTHTKIAAQCLTALTGIQRDLMSQQGPGAGSGGGGMGMGR